LNLPGALRAPAGPFTIRVLGWLHLSAAEHTRTLVSLATSRTSTNAGHPAVRPSPGSSVALPAGSLPSMRIHIVGTFEECEHAADRIARVLDAATSAGSRGETTGYVR
jgi:hypothetical protein